MASKLIAERRFQGARGQPCSTIGSAPIERGGPVSVVMACSRTALTLGLARILEEDSYVRAVSIEPDLAAVAREISTAARPIVVLEESVECHALLALRAVREDVGLLVIARRRSPLLASFLETVGARVLLSDLTPGDAHAEVYRASIASLLTERELEIYEHLRDGLRNAEIAQALQISVETVRAHAKSVYRKLDVSGRAELA